ncbi:MAG: homoserine O-acetyltransferase [Actinomycetes bacterium]
MVLDTETLPPASAAWREGDPRGQRQFADVGALRLELGGSLPLVRVAYETYGRLNPDGSNAVLVLHALTGDSHLSGPAGQGHPTPGWWEPLLSAGGPLDPAEWFVVAPNVLGGCQGTTGPTSSAPDGRPWGSRFPRITVRDQVVVERRLTAALGVDAWAAVIGGSMGGMRSLEWAITYPDALRAALVVAVGAAASADQIGTQTAQIAAITADPKWRGGDYHDAAAGDGPYVGMGVARRFAHLTYRTEVELDVRFGTRAQDGEDPLTEGRFAVQSYLDHHADKLARRFDAGTYVALTDAMSTHDVGRGRGGVSTALASIRVPVVIGGIDSDRLYPLRMQEELAKLIPTAEQLDVITSPYGHDGFLLEMAAVSALVKRTLTRSEKADRNSNRLAG